MLKMGKIVVDIYRIFTHTQKQIWHIKTKGKLIFIDTFNMEINCLSFLLIGMMAAIIQTFCLI